MKVGDYVRTKYGIIGKITEIVDFNQKNEKPYLNHRNMLVLTNNENECVTGSRGEIIASSPNIIDLIEVGDYVNGFKVLYKGTDTDDYGNDYQEVQVEKEGFINYYLKEKDIKSILTHEQFSQMEYKVEE